MARILVVDDEPFNRELISAVFANRPHQVVEAGDGKNALRAAAADAPDVVITDLSMPHMDGPRFIKALRELPGCGTCEVVLYTATRTDTPAMRDFMALSGVRYAIEKPAEPDEIVRIVEAALARERSK